MPPFYIHHYFFLVILGPLAKSIYGGTDKLELEQPNVSVLLDHGIPFGSEPIPPSSFKMAALIVF